MLAHGNRMEKIGSIRKITEAMLNMNGFKIAETGSIARVGE